MEFINAKEVQKAFYANGINWDVEAMLDEAKNYAYCNGHCGEAFHYEDNDYQMFLDLIEDAVWSYDENGEIEDMISDYKYAVRWIDFEGGKHAGERIGFNWDGDYSWDGKIFENVDEDEDEDEDDED